MREKVLNLISITMGPFDPAVEHSVETIKNAFLMEFGEKLPKDNEFFSLIYKEAMSRKNDLLERVAAIYEERFNESEIDEQISFFKTDAAKKREELGLLVTDAIAQWEQKILVAINEEACKMFGAPEEVAPQQSAI